MSKDIIKPIIGMEIHVELATETKMFCRCRNNFGDAPNTNICPVCTAMPGALPVMNRKAVEYSIKVGLALGCEVPNYTKWDRKNYYYPDLPKGYQLSQYDLPLCSNGVVEFPKEDGSTKPLRVLRAHLEEDAGKNTHDIPDASGVDLNRAGVPLLEIVSQPDMNTLDEVMYYARGMHRLVRWLGVSEANMQMGHMRFEPNINLHITRDGKTYKTPIVEVKNLNSFRSLEGAVKYEVRRQYGEFNKDPEGFSLEKLGKQNRGYDPDTEQTVFQREKEDAHDYRYFPEPDLPAVVVSDEWRESIAGEVGELPYARRDRYMKDYSLGFKEADALTQDRATGDLLDQAVAGGASVKRCCNLLLGRGAAIANEKGCNIAEIGLNAGGLGELARMMDDGEVNATAGAKIFDIMVETGGNPKEIAKNEGLLIVRDDSQVEKWVDEAIANNPQAVEEIRQGGKKQAKSFGFLTGQVMQASRGAANPAQVQELLKKKLGS